MPSRVGVVAFLAVLLLGVGAPVAEAHHAQPDVLGAVYAAAQRHGVEAEPLVALVLCESHGEAHAEGDERWRDGRFVPTSRGATQLSDLPTGLAHHFWNWAGYTDRDDPEQAADYLARVATGEFLRDGTPLHPYGLVTLARWTCGRLLGLS
jgi:hypothetical protein